MERDADLLGAAPADAETPEELRGRIAELERRLEQMETRRNFLSPGWLDGVLPPDVRGHFRSGSRQQLLAARTLLDHWIRRLGGEDNPAEEPNAAPRETIRIE